MREKGKAEGGRGKGRPSFVFRHEGGGTDEGGGGFKQRYGEGPQPGVLDARCSTLDALRVMCKFGAPDRFNIS